MRFQMVLGLLFVAGCAASSSSSVDTSAANVDVGDAGTADGGACVGVRVDTLSNVGVSGGGATISQFVSGMTATTADGDNTITITLPQGNSSAVAIARSLPSTDITVAYSALVSPDDFLSPTAAFTATSGDVSCGPLVDGDYPCTFTNVVFTPSAGTDASACATSAPATFTLHARLASQ